MFLYNLDLCMSFIINYAFLDVLLSLGIIFPSKISYVLLIKWQLLEMFHFTTGQKFTRVILLMSPSVPEKKWLIYSYMVVLKATTNKNQINHLYASIISKNLNMVLLYYIKGFSRPENDKHGAHRFCLLSLFILLNSS